MSHIPYSEQEEHVTLMAPSQPKAVSLKGAITEILEQPTVKIKATPMQIVNDYHEKMLQHDPVNKPAHYNTGGIECIDYIRQVLGEEGFKAYCLGNTMKYLHRHEYKGKPQEDLKKAAYYLNKAISTYDGDTK
jgi:hypothetical protein